MSEFEQFSPDAWEFEGVLWVTPKKAPSKPGRGTRQSPWLAFIPVVIAAATFAGSSELRASDSAVVAALEQKAYASSAAAEDDSADLVPAGYWARVGRFLETRRELVEEDGPELEPLL